MTRRSRFVAITLVAVLGLAACANNDAKESDVVNAMRDAGLNSADAECVGAGFEEAFGDDQELFNEVAGAAEPEDLPGDSRGTVESIFDEFGIGDAGAADTEATDADTTETTEDGAAGDGPDEDATTTTAAS